MEFYNDVVVYLVGNKIDNLNNDEEEIGESIKEDMHKPVTKKEKEKLKRDLKILNYYEISNKWNLNIDEVTARIILDVAKIIDNKKVDEGRKTIKSDKQKKKKCCK